MKLFIWCRAGMALAIFLGRLGSLACLPLIIARKGGSALRYLRSMFRPCIAAATILCVCFFATSLVPVQTWLSLMLIATLLALLSAGFIWLVGLTQNQRQMLIKHLATLIPKPAKC